MANTKNPAEQNLVDNAPEGMALSDADLKAARAEGAKQDVQENAKDSHHFLTDGNLPGEPADTRWFGHDESQPWAFYLDGSLDALKKAVKDGNIPDNKLYGLLALERNGKNRTEYVKYMVDQLGPQGRPGQGCGRCGGAAGRRPFVHQRHDRDQRPVTNEGGHA